MKYEYITKTAKQVSRSWSNKDAIRFQYFNPNGLYAQKQALNDIIWSLVEQGKAKSGAVLAYGAGCTFYDDELRALFNKSRVTDIEYSVMVSGYKFAIEMAEKFIAETK